MDVLLLMELEHMNEWHMGFCFAELTFISP